MHVEYTHSINAPKSKGGELKEGETSGMDIPPKVKQEGRNNYKILLIEERRRVNAIFGKKLSK
jgi:hypothetical protein